MEWVCYQPFATWVQRHHKEQAPVVVHETGRVRFAEAILVESDRAPRLAALRIVQAGGAALERTQAAPDLGQGRPSLPPYPHPPSKRDESSDQNGTPKVWAEALQQKLKATHLPADLRQPASAGAWRDAYG